MKRRSHDPDLAAVMAALGSRAGNAEAKLRMMQRDVDAVLALHAGTFFYRPQGHDLVCKSCHTAYPCPTAVALGAVK